MRDTYIPEPTTTALCPHCGLTIDGAPGANETLLRFTLLRWKCPRCERDWDEIRNGHGAERYWDVLALAYQHARMGEHH